MPLFICEKCKCIENTALGHYWGRNHVNFKLSELSGKALCSECTPKEYSDGTKTDKGNWHNYFKKEVFNTEFHNPKDYLNSDKFV
jgi:hypothetical protein